MKTAPLALALLIAATAQAQQRPHEKFCASGDNTIECVGRRNQENIDRFVQEQKDKAKKEMERIEAEKAERERLKSIREKDCNPRVRRCD